MDLMRRELYRATSQGCTQQSKLDFKHRKPLWTNGCHNPSWVHEELTGTGLAVSSTADNAENMNEKIEAIHSHQADTAFYTLLRACTKKKDLCRGTMLHAEVLKRGLLDRCSFVEGALVNMYAKCGALAKAQDLLVALPVRDVFSWTQVMMGYALKGQGHEALNCFERMRHEGISPDAVTFSCILKTCGSIGASDKGEKIHDEIAQEGLLKNNIVLGTALVDMYAKCGALAKAQQVLDELPARDAISWSALISGYAQQGQGEEALKCFERMQGYGLSPDAVTYSCILKACGSVGAIDKGEQIHDEIVRRGLLRKNVALGTALVNMYAKCGALAKAQGVLNELPARDAISWSALIAGYAQQGQGEEALKCFERMRGDGLSPDAVTFICILKACGSIGATDKGEQIHDEIVRQGLLRKNVVLGTALVDMYAKCGAFAKAQGVLNELPVRDVVSWSVLIAGYAQQRQGQEALDCFARMQREGLSPNAVTYTSILKACGTLGAADKGEQIHHEIARQGLLKSNLVLRTALVDMYAKCGAFAKAQQVLEDLPVGDVVSWSALITGYAQQGRAEEAVNCFKLMQQKGLSPDGITFSCVLNACNHSGLVEEGQKLFSDMSARFGIKPELEHYACMVDLLGHTGHLDKALQMIQRMPSSNCSAVWSVLLDACQKWGDVRIGRWAFEHAVRVDRTDVAPYLRMADIYAAAGMQEDKENIEAMRVKNKASTKKQDAAGR